MKFLAEQKIYYALRVASAMCFIGHGAFGIITKQIWVNYFGVFGIGHDTAYSLMPLVGTIDILMGIIILAYPLRLAISWLVLWGIITALLRPLSGEPFAEFIERAGNFGAPLALLILSGNGLSFRKMFVQVKADIHTGKERLTAVTNCLRIVVFLLFAGHGWLNIIEKKSLVDEYFRLGFANPGNVAQVIGLFEIIAALVLLIRPLRYVVLALFIWKVASELFYPHYELFEWIERAGSYGALLALYFALDASTSFNRNVDDKKESGFFKSNHSVTYYPSSDYNLN